MKVTKIGRAHFKVSSESEPDPHQVDLEMNGGIGACDCYDFKFRCQPEIDEAFRLGTELFISFGTYRQMCKHIMAARWEFTNQVLGEMSKRFNKEQV